MIGYRYICFWHIDDYQQFHGWAVVLTVIEEDIFTEKIGVK